MIQKKPIRVLQIIRHMNVGGAETFIMNVYRNIDRDKIQFDFLVNDVGFFDDEIRKLGGRIFYMKYITNVGQIRYKKDLISFFAKHKEYNIIHTHIDQVSGIILEAAKESGIPNRIVHSHSTKNTNSILGKIYKRYLQKKINSNATILLACGIDAAKWLYTKQYKRAIIINNGIDIKKYKFSEEKRNTIRKELKIEENTVVLGHVGRFSKVKNHDFLIKIYKSYIEKNSNSILILVGIGKEKERIEKIVRKEKIENNVRFMGLRSDTDAIYSAMDCMIFPSIYEGLSLALIEAQIAGVNVVASDSIDKRTDISGNIKWISLKESPEVWSKYIEINKKRKIDNIDILDYDIKNTVRKMTRIYMNLGENYE